MILYIWRYNTTSGKFEKTAVIDSAVSVIWITRYRNAGQFELYLRMSRDMFRLFFDYMHDVLVTRDDSDAVMIVEDIKVTTDEENGDFMTVTGTDGGGLLGRRIIPKQTVFSGTAEYCIRSLINQNLISPENERRKMSFFTLGTAVGYPEQIDTQITGKNLLDAVSDICAAYGYGFKIRFDGNNFIFDLYQGIDRSTDQTENNPVIFSPDYENIGTTEFTFGKSGFKTAVYVAGEGEGSDRIIVQSQYAGEDTGMWRREMWQDSRNTSRTSDDGEISMNDYTEMLHSQGVETLKDNLFLYHFEGETLQINAYKYGVDYNLGDKVRIQNRYRIGANATVSEITEVEDAEGYRLIPTFSEWEV